MIILLALYHSIDINEEKMNVDNSKRYKIWFVVVCWGVSVFLTIGFAIFRNMTDTEDIKNLLNKTIPKS